MLMMVVVCMGAADALVAQSAPAAKRPQTAPPGGQAAAKAAGPRTTAKAAADAAPVIVVETDKGTFEFTTFPKEAPKSVEHIVTLVKRNFYNGQHFHRVEPNFVVQWGSATTKDMRYVGSAGWGSGGSGKAIGVSEISPLHKHKLGSVALANAGDPTQADSQLYVLINGAKAPGLDGKYTVIGQVISGMNVVQKIQKNDMIKRVTLKAETPAAK
jgi:cyclophilin family peptidyl-prolyl cis-trans isomerase